MVRKKMLVTFTMLALIVVLPLSAQAAPVGKLIMVQGHVDLLKQGKLPALAAKVNDGVEPGDVIRTKAKAKAQVLFVDDTTLTLAPESRVAIADYLYDGRTRRATLHLFRGMVHTLVKKIIQLQEPDFVMQTHTAAVGVRGTEWYTIIKPASTLVYNTTGRLGVETRNPTNLLLEAMFWVEIFRDRIVPPRPITPVDLDLLRKLMDTGVPENQEFQVTPPVGQPGAPGYQMPGDPERGLPLYVPPIYQRDLGPREKSPGPSITPGPGQGG